MGKLLGVDRRILIMVRAGLRAIRSVRSTRRIGGGLSIVGRFSETPEGQMRVKMSIFFAMTMDLTLFPWSNEDDGP